jgi:hypothetical protein
MKSLNKLIFNNFDSKTKLLFSTANQNTRNLFNFSRCNFARNINSNSNYQQYKDNLKNLDNKDTNENETKEKTTPKKLNMKNNKKVNTEVNEKKPENKVDVNLQVNKIQLKKYFKGAVNEKLLDPTKFADKEIQIISEKSDSLKIGENEHKKMVNFRGKYTEKIKFLRESVKRTLDNEEM